MGKPRARSVFQIQRDGKRIVRSPLTEVEILLNELIWKAEQRGRIGYIAFNKIVMKDGSRPSWSAYYTINEDVKRLKAKVLKQMEKK